MVIQVPYAAGNFRKPAAVNPKVEWSQAGVVVKSKQVEMEWTKEQLKNKFKSCDLDGDGKLSKNEIKKVFKDLGSSSGFYRAKKALWRADADHNGYVDINDKEFEDLVQYAFECHYKIKDY